MSGFHRPHSGFGVGGHTAKCRRGCNIGKEEEGGREGEEKEEKEERALLSEGQGAKSASATVGSGEHSLAAVHREASSPLLCERHFDGGGEERRGVGDSGLQRAPPPLKLQPRFGDTMLISIRPTSLRQWRQTEAPERPLPRRASSTMLWCSWVSMCPLPPVTAVKMGAGGGRGRRRGKLICCLP